MPLETNGHASEESLESYAMGSLEEPGLGELEEHLLICSGCQERLNEIDMYHAAMKTAAAQLEKNDESRKNLRTRISGAWTFRRTGWAMALIALILCGLAARMWLRPAAAGPEVALALETSRGADIRHAPAGRPLALSLDIKGLPAYAAYQVETVDAEGQVQAQSTAAVAEGRVNSRLDKGLRPGTYFVRLYTPARELLREYGLAID